MDQGICGTLDGMFQTNGKQQEICFWIGEVQYLEVSPRYHVNEFQAIYALQAALWCSR